MPSDVLKATSGRPTGRPTAEAADALAGEVMDAALAVFVESGFDGASMEAIARAAGVTKRTLYRRAGSKTELFVDVVERLAHRSGIHDLSRITTGSLEEKLKAASDVLLTWLLEPDGLALYRIIVANAVRHPGLALTVDAPFQRAIEDIASILAAEGDQSPEASDLGARLFFRLVAGEALDRAAQGIEPAGMSDEKRARAYIAVHFFLAGWKSWRVPQ